jgi:hypothetical protein
MSLTSYQTAPPRAISISRHVLEEPARALETMIRPLQGQPAGQGVAQGRIEKEEPRVMHLAGPAATYSPAS